MPPTLGQPLEILNGFLYVLLFYSQGIPTSIDCFDLRFNLVKLLFEQFDLSLCAQTLEPAHNAYKTVRLHTTQRVEEGLNSVLHGQCFHGGLKARELW